MPRTRAFPALLWCALGAALAGCGADRCEQLCTRTSARLGTCLDEWPATWADLDADSQQDFLDQCDSSWSSVRAELEPRELDDALEQCDEAYRTLGQLNSAGEVCDHLRALYLE